MSHDTEQAEGGVGARVRVLRMIDGTTQARLADRANVSASLISQVERGVVPASPAFIDTVARALGVDRGALTDAPAPADTPRGFRDHALIAPLRRELASYRLPPARDPGPIDLDALEARVHTASKLRHAADLTSLGSELPPVLAALRAAIHALDGATRERAYALLAEAHAAAGQVVYKLGYSDLSSLTTDRVEWAAERSGDPYAVAAAAFYRAGELIAAADYRGALDYLEHSRTDIEDDALAGIEPAQAMWGQLHLKSGLAAARSGDLPQADAHVAEARDTASRLPDGRDDYRLAFGTSSVDIWSVGLAVEAMDGTEAVKRAAAMPPPAQAPKERVGHHWIDTARGFLLHGDRQKSLAALMKARKVTPQQTRHHPQVAETIRLLVEGDRRRSDTLSGLARWAGVAA